MKLIINIIILSTFVQLSAQSILKNNLSEPTSYSGMIDFLKETTRANSIFELGWMGKSFEGKSIPYIKISSTGFNKNSGKIVFMIFAQQHGNEPAGKEALLSLIKNFKNHKLNYLLDKIDFIIVPQVNPDAAEINKRIGSSGYDLNRQHLTLNAEEILYLHELFNKYLPDVTLDLHEYFPYTKEWKELGYRKNFDVSLGLSTNPNTAKELLDISNKKVLPFVKNYVEKEGYTFGEYTKGIVPKSEPVRYSNLGIYDGRQSFGILNTLSFIVEVRNGEKVSSNLYNRMMYAKTAVLALSDFVSKNTTEIKKIVKASRKKLLNAKEGEVVSIRTKFGLGKNLNKMKLVSFATGKDTSVYFPFDSEVISTLNVTKPSGYLIAENDSTMLNFLKGQKIKFLSEMPRENIRVIRYKVDPNNKNELTAQLDQVGKSKDNIPHFEMEDVIDKIDLKQYVYIPVNQLTSNLIVLAFEPQSFQSIYLDKKYSYLLSKNGYFNILRLETKIQK